MAERFPGDDAVAKVMGWITEPGEAGESLLALTWDDGLRALLRAMIEGLPLPRILRRFEREFGRAEVAASAEALTATHRALLGNVILKPLFNDEPSVQRPAARAARRGSAPSAGARARASG